MSFKKTGTFIQVEVDKVICDFCGDEMSHSSAKDHALVMHFNFGYLSKRDGEHWDWDACDVCAEKVLARLKAWREKTGMAISPIDLEDFCGAD
jgi:hypothetical protein